MATRVKAEEAAEPKGTTWLAEHINEKLGTEYTGYQVRILLRKLAKDGDIDRGEGRYSFSGPNDTTVKQVLAAIRSGKADKAKDERLEALKAKKAATKSTGPAAKKATTKKAASSSRRRAAKPEPEADEDDEDVDLDEI